MRVALDHVEGAAHLEPEPQDVPLQRAVLAHRLVGKAVDLADIQDVGAQPSDYGTAALGTEIEG